MEGCEAGGPWHSATQSHLLGLYLQRLRGLSVSLPDPRPQGWERGAESPAVWAAGAQGWPTQTEAEGGHSTLPVLTCDSLSRNGRHTHPLLQLGQPTGHTSWDTSLTPGSLALSFPPMGLRACALELSCGGISRFAALPSPQHTAPPRPAPTAFRCVPGTRGHGGFTQRSVFSRLRAHKIAKRGAWCTLRSFSIKTLRFRNIGVKGNEEAGIQPWEPGGDARGSVGLPQGEVSPGGPDRPVKSPDF